jgi:hypothetical protein
MKKYFIFSIILIGLIGLFVFIEDNSITTFELFGISISLPNALWVVIFLSIFLIFSIIFIAFSNLKNTFYKKAVTKDIDTIIENIKNQIFYKNNFKDTKILTNINNFIKNIKGLEIEPKKVEKFEFLEDIEKLKNGEVIEISKYRLENDNPWFILNVKNRLKKEPNYAKEVLKKFKNEELKKEAFYIYAKNAEIKEILKYDYPITLDIILAHIDNPQVTELLKRAKLSPKDEITIAKKLYNQDPEKELKIIEPLKWGYAYLAIKYEHLDLAKEIIQENNLEFFEYYLKLREAGIKADIDEYINSAI